MLERASASLIKDLKKQKRENSSLLFFFFLKIIKDAINYGLKPLYIFVDDEKFNIWGDGEKVLKVDRKTIEQLSDSKTPQGVLCIAEYIPNIVKKPQTNFLVIDKLQDPGNVGTLIRTALACGFDNIFLVDSVRINNSKLIRSSVGTIFQAYVMEISTEDFILKFKEWDLSLIKADMKGENIFNFTYDGIVGLVIGNEGQGVSKEISQLCKYNISIPMKDKVESLNASISGAIIMYQLAKNNF